MSKRAIRRAQKAVNQLIRDHASRGRLAGGLASEGYNGGYSAALADVLLVLDKCAPCRNPEFWIEPRGDSGG